MASFAAARYMTSSFFSFGAVNMGNSAIDFFICLNGISASAGLLNYVVALSSLVVLVLQQGSNCGERQTDGDELLAYRPAQQRASYEDLRATILKRLLSMVCHLQNNGVAVRMGQKDAYQLADCIWFFYYGETDVWIQFILSMTSIEKDGNLYRMRFLFGGLFEMSSSHRNRYAVSSLMDTAYWMSEQ
ncbi:hypothetical protein Tco_0692009 [Tanacetum coccineum]